MASRCTHEWNHVLLEWLQDILVVQWYCTKCGSKKERKEVGKGYFSGPFQFLRKLSLQTTIPNCEHELVNSSRSHSHRLLPIIGERIQVCRICNTVIVINPSVEVEYTETIDFDA